MIYVNNKGIRWKGVYDVEKWLYMYDVRGIQDYIFRTNKVKEIIGASLLVEDLILSLFMDVTQDLGLNVVDDLSYENELKFSFDSDNDIDVEILYYGGGNLLVLFENGDIGQQVSRKMCIELVKRTYSLQLAVAKIKVSGQNHYKEDYQRLRNEMDSVKANMPMAIPVTGFPITSNDPQTGFPFSKKDFYHQKVTYETYKKLEKYNMNRKTGTPGYEHFGEHEGESLIAIVHIDGNNMGQHIADKMEKVTSYQDAARVSRQISSHIQHVFSERALKKVESSVDKLCEKAGISKNAIEMRTIIHAGDDITFICHAKIAMACVRIFMDELEKEGTYHACAGIFVTHAHFPFARGYELSEELCSNAKKLSRIHPGNYVDFHINTTGVLNDIKYIRKKYYRNIDDQPLIARPYYMGKDSVQETKLTSLLNTLNILKKSHIARSKLKDLRSVFQSGDILVREQLNGINSRLKDEDKVYFDNYRLLFDAIDVMDFNWGDDNE